MLETLHDLNIPYILSIGGADAETTQMAHKINGQNPNLGLIGDWMPQSAILAHPALLAFLTHGGSNSVIEAIINATPLGEYYCTWGGSGATNVQCFGLPRMIKYRPLLHSPMNLSKLALSSNR